MSPLCQSLSQGSHTSWKVLDFFLENFLEKHFGPGRSWKLKIKVLESPGKITVKITHFYWFKGKKAAIVNVPLCVDFYFYLFLKTTTVNILLHATVSAVDCTPNVVSKRCSSLYLSIPGLQKGPGKFLTGSWKVPEKSWIFFQ